MTPDQRLVSCKKCLNRKMDFDKGMLCGISGNKPEFEVECSTFSLDAEVKEPAIFEDDDFDVSTVMPEGMLERFRLEQNLPMGLLAGVVVGIVGAVLWGAITLLTGYQIGYMAIAIGAGVGYAVRYFGKGIDQSFAIMGAAIALLSCVCGNGCYIIGAVANEYHVGYWQAFTGFEYSLLPAVMKETFSPMDLLFYGIAVYEGYRFSLRKITPADIEAMKARR